MFAVLLPLLLTACGLSPQQKADYSAVQGSGVSPAIYDKMLHDDDLSISDIESLSRARVNGGVILRYIRDQGTVYYLGTSDIKGLQRAGVDPSVIDYMLQTARGGYWGQGPYPYFGGYDPYFFGPGFGFGFGYGFGYGGYRGGYHGGGGGHGGHH
jgi:hypothetical protein